MFIDDDPWEGNQARVNMMATFEPQSTHPKRAIATLWGKKQRKSAALQEGFKSPSNPLQRPFKEFLQFKIENAKNALK